MKNRYASGSHFSKKKFRLLVKYFCMELTATQISELLKVNRKTANLWLGKIRQRIYELVEEERMSNAKCVQMDKTYFTKAMEYYPKYKFPYQEIAVFGIINEQNKVYAKIVDKVNKREVFSIIQQCYAKNAIIYTDSAVLYKGLSKLGYSKAYRAMITKHYSLGL
ncbi:MAG: transposase [Alphaproteobacteria bacterium]|nr:transposase [Alphaproteobacteria bacterium]MBQ9235131.1 transposase [Alphaproteobacteria bacterium]